MKKKLQTLFIIGIGAFLFMNLNFSQDQKLSHIIPVTIYHMMRNGIEIDYSNAKLNPHEFIEDLLNYYSANNLNNPDDVQSIEMLECLGERWENSAWVNDFKEIMSYDANFNLSQTLTMVWENNAWVNESKWTYQYDSNGNQTSQLIEDWENNAWVQQTQWLYSYDANGNETGWEWQVWENNSWKGFMKWIYSYGANNLMTQMIQQMWDSGSYTDFTRITYTYDASSNLSEELMEMFLGIWMNNSKTFYTWDANHNNTEILSQNWDMMSNAWVNSSKETQTFNTNNLITEYIFQEWSGSSWQNQWKYINHYTNSFLTLFQTYQWDGSSWQNETKSIYTYDAQNFLTESLMQDWDGNNWVNDSKFTYTYGEPATSAEDEKISPLNFELKQNYPNPFNPSTTIEFSIANLSFVNLEVFDLLGKSVSILLSKELYPGNYTITFEGKNLTSGVYYYKLKSADCEITRKMMLIK